MAEIKLSDAQKARIERNRQRALTLRNARLSNRPYPVTKSRDSASAATQDLVASGSSARVIDTGGGFLLDAEDEETLNTAPKNLVEEPAPIIGGDQLHCDECQSEFLTSYIYKHFDVCVCDNCRSEEKHALITKTEAREQFLLKDCDFDRREPPLKFILKKNPHYSRGEMKLYLKSQRERLQLQLEN
ncbi:PREDICTED: DNA repair protein complementing XP-A cells-like isoform X2 [Acropora digitifera]|uniref:DNA repair protein complementing XP-A cells-like isoform X2 n=1 Tax=Acropora digitifera TaxID=70779 RepID=UPI00077AEA2F|nr:PREDICTED: DNA repair protein complementing XP-A cells-like isoform X2 [Acropora digitifera]XP_015754046.1 PREDICTED: DNA repair protein complementing XP-A cells-like isoform X2 [Acropora digitifera]